MSQGIFADIDATVTTGLMLADILNDFRDAVLSNYSGLTAPASPVPFQWWADTTTGLLKIRNAANDAWVVSGPLASSIPTSVSSTYAALVTDSTIVCTSGTFTVTLPAVASMSGRKLTIINAGAGVITEDGNGSETLNGALNQTLDNQYSAHTWYCDGTQWILIG